MPIKNKVSDEELLNAIWLLQVRKTAKGCINNYFGGLSGLKSDSSRRYASDIHLVCDRHQIDVDLSSGHLRKRLIQLIDGGFLQWGTRKCTFWIDSEKAKEVFDYAVSWWQSKGVPSGYDQDKKSMRCEKIEGFDELVKELEEELVYVFGESEMLIECAQTLGMIEILNEE